MYATIYRHRRVIGMADGLANAARYACSSLRQTAGFVACFLIDSEPDIITVVCLCEDQVSLKEAESLISASLRDQLATLTYEEPQVTRGEIIFQRGL